MDRSKGDPEPSGPLIIDLLGHPDTGIDMLMDRVLHHTGVPPDELSVRRILSYCNNLEDLLRTDANVYGLGTE